MATEFSMLGIMNAALLAQGQEEILSMNDGSVEWRLLFRNWPGIVEAELEDSNYQFTREQQQLVTRTDGKFMFDDGYLIPAEALHVRKLWIEDSSGNTYSADWIQDGSYVYLDYDEGCWIEYIVANDPDLWSASFSRGIQLKLEALISRAVKEEIGEARDLEAMAEIQLQRARSSSSRQRSATKPYKAGAISKARRGRRWHG